MKKAIIPSIIFLLAINCSYAQWINQSGTGNYYITSGNVGIGYSAPALPLVIIGSGNVQQLSNQSDQDLVFSLSAPGATSKYAMIAPSTSTNLAFGVAGGEKIRVTNAGYFGIGTTTPSTYLHVHAAASSPLINIQNTTITSYSQLAYTGTGRTFYSGVGNASETTYGVPNSWFVFDGTSNVMRMVITSAGSVLIGQTTTSPGLNTAYMLNVAGTARMKAVTVNTTGADFVFEPKYKLLPLADLGRYLSQNHHLPGIAPAEQMRAQGLNLGENQTLLLQKVEELTLYLIEKDKQLTEEKQKNEEQEARIKKLETEMDSILKNKKQ